MNQKKILVIEDQPAMRRNTVLILEMEGYCCHAAANGSEGLETARRELPDLILCDITMPEMDGFALLETVRSESALSSTPFIFLSARSDKQDRAKGLGLGAHGYLTKPVAHEDLMAEVRRLI